MVINHNLQAMNAQRQLGINSTNLSKASEKLSSGLRINRAGDDAAGLALSEKMRSQIKGLNQASRNAQDGISLIQTAEGALDEVHEMLKRMRELSVQSANDTYTDSDRSKIQLEVDQLISEIDEISNRTEFNEQKLLSGGFSEKKIHVGANKDQSIEITISSMSADDLGITDLSVAAQSDANGAISTIDEAIELVSSQRASLGAIQNRLEHSIKNVNNTSENLQSAESRIRDTDMASEMMNFTTSNILSQAAQSMLAQTNQRPNQVLQLLG
jgi:flagellin